MVQAARTHGVSRVKFQQPTPHAVSPPLARITFVPQMLAIEIAIGIQTEFVRMNAGHGNRHRVVGSDLTDLLRIGKEDAPVTILNNADSRVSRRGHDGEEEEYSEDQVYFVITRAEH